MCTQPSNVGLDLSIFEFDQQMLKLIHQIGCVWKQGIPNPLNMTRSRLLAGHEMFLHQNGRKVIFINLPGPFLAMCSKKWVHIFGTPCKIHNRMRWPWIPRFHKLPLHQGSSASQDKSLWVNQRLKGTYRNFWSCFRECLTPWSSFLTSYYLLMIFEYFILTLQSLSNDFWMFGVFLSSSCVCVFLCCVFHRCVWLLNIVEMMILCGVHVWPMFCMIIETILQWYSPSYVCWLIQSIYIQ
jgi:hypothetical protein